MAEGTGKGGKIVGIAKKRARRVQEKMMQKFGKSEHTTDEVYEEFVANFNKQQNVATRVQRETLRYMHSLRLMYQSCKSLKETLSEVYEPEWAGHDKYKDHMERKILLWEDQLTTLHSRMVEPLSNYLAKFPEVKNRMAKRDRKVVDYDMTRRELESQRQKVRVNDQKLQQAEDTFATAKQLFDELTDDLYEELPTFYDSRIEFYASIFQSMFSTEARFHTEIAREDEQFAGLMEALTEEAATGVHTTKKERTTVSTPKITSRPGEDSDDESDADRHSHHEEPPLSPVTPITLATPGNGEAASDDSQADSNGTPSPTTPSRTPIQTGSSEKRIPPKPAPFSGSFKKPPPTKPVRALGTVDLNAAPVTNGVEDTEPAPPIEEVKDPVVPGDEDVPEGTAEDGGEADKPKEEAMEDMVEVTSPVIKTPPPKPAPLLTVDEEEPKVDGFIPEVSDKKASSGEEEDTPAGGENGGEEGRGEEGGGEEGGNLVEEQAKEQEVPPVETQTSDEPPVSVKQPPNVLFKVVAAHPYSGEDEDELCFDKGDIVLVIPYEDHDDEEEGWLMGVVEGTDKCGVFPENFTKRME